MLSFDGIYAPMNFKNRIVNQRIATDAAVPTQNDMDLVLLPILHYQFPHRQSPACADGIRLCAGLDFLADLDVLGQLGVGHLL